MGSEKINSLSFYLVILQVGWKITKHGTRFLSQMKLNSQKLKISNQDEKNLNKSTFREKKKKKKHTQKRGKSVVLLNYIH